MVDGWMGGWVGGRYLVVTMGTWTHGQWAVGTVQIGCGRFVNGTWSVE